jgi:hypothetical protein
MGVCTSGSRAVVCDSLDESAKVAAGEARRALIEFLLALRKGDYRTANLYYPSPHEFLRNLDVELDPGIALLERHCKRDGGVCLIPIGEFEAQHLASPPFVFTVSFRWVDGEQYTVGAQTDFEFRVAPTESGYKVLDLPPTGPPPPP